MKKAMLTGCQADAAEILGLLAGAVERSGLKEHTFCTKYLRDNGSLRQRLLDGRVTPRKMLSVHNTLTNYLA